MKFKFHLGLLIFLSFTLIGIFPNQANASCATPDVLIVLDQSGSMSRSNKWTNAVKAINTITSKYKGKLRFGLLTFTTGCSVRYGLNQCIKDGVSTKCVPNLQGVLRRLSPGGGTSLIAAISTARSHYQMIRNQDSVKNRKRSVMFITDGKASCANSQVQQLRQALGVKTYVIGFGSGVDGTCLNSMASAGQTGRYYKADNSSELNKAMHAIANASSAEVCNGVDDDCDGLTDETYPEKGRPCKVPGVSGPCSKSHYVCRNGKLLCPRVGNGTAEKCNNIDDDCDGQIDENLHQPCHSKCGTGQETCRAGHWVGCTAPKPKKEQCNNKDDDCDGQIDENLHQPCRSKCGTGQATCKAGQWVNCTARKPQPESCNNKDDDCDGQIDEGLHQPCRTICGTGEETCKAGQWVNCTAPKPTQEMCDGKDNDCDGEVDEGLTQKCKSICGEGKEKCVAGQWVDCDARKPVKEVCNNRDDDCDGRIDNVVPTPDCPKCVDGVCYQTCTTECTQGKLCKQGICVENPCARARCGNDEICKNGKCINACSGVKCPAGQICIKGKCQAKTTEDCRKLGCPGGQVCKSGRCVKDPCRNVKCTGRFFCRDGKCVESCYNVICQHGTICKDGKCVPQPCGGQCPKGKTCYKDKCIETKKHPCAGIKCPKGEYCEEGKCLNACDGVQCPDGHVCHHGQCYGGVTPPPKDDNPITGDENTQQNEENTQSTFEKTTAQESPGNMELPTSSVEKQLGDGGNGGNPNDPNNRINRTPGGCVCNTTTNQPTDSSFFLLFLLSFLLLFKWPRRKS